MLKVQNESVSIQTFREKLRAIKRVISETVNYAETIIRIRGIGRIINNTIQLSTTSFTASGFIRFYSESISVSENITRVRGLFRVINNTVQTSETLRRALSDEMKKIWDAWNTSNNKMYESATKALQGTKVNTGISLALKNSAS